MTLFNFEINSKEVAVEEAQVEENRKKAKGEENGEEERGGHKPQVAIIPKRVEVKKKG